jgi:hypothetical protein
MFSNLTKIMLDHNWDLFSSHLPVAVATNRERLGTDLRALNALRNRLAHPTRPFLPTKADFAFARGMRDSLLPDKWRLPHRLPA